LNQLTDLTLNRNFAGICGFTFDELERFFATRMSDVLGRMKESGDMPNDATEESLRSQIADWYDGYSWDGATRVLNPLSILELFSQAEFRSHWAGQQESSSFLSAFNEGELLAILGDTIDGVPSKAFDPTSVGTIAPAAALFQAGYLTVDTVIKTFGNDPTYSLRKPNWEVRLNCLDTISERIFSILKRAPNVVSDEFMSAAEMRDAGKLTELFAALYAGLAAIHQVELKTFYNSMLYSYVAGLGPLVLSEAPGANGTPDIVLLCREGLCAVIELKFNDCGSDVDAATKVILLKNRAEDALKAIETKRYAVRYRTYAHRMLKIGLGVVTRGECLALIGD
jgi:hypothetical protein